MAKWADYLVSAVRYVNSSKSRISHLMVHDDNDDQVGTGKICTKECVIENINHGKIYYTIIMSDGRNWKQGEKIIVFKGKYLKTVQNAIEEDNLGALPEF